MATRVDTLEPMPGPEPEPEGPPGRKLTPREWMRENLFGSKLDTVLTVALRARSSPGSSTGSGGSSSWTRAGRSSSATSRTSWSAAIRATRSGACGPRSSSSRPSSAWAPARSACSGAARSRRAARVPCPRAALRRLVPIILLVVVLLWFARSLQAVVLVAAIAAVGAAFNAIGRRTPERLWRYVPLIVLAGILVGLHHRDRLRRRGLERVGRVPPHGLPGRRRRSCSPSRSASCSRSGGGRASRSCAGCASRTSSSSAACR